jgi:hypothetical protein
VRLPEGTESALVYLIRAVKTLVNPTPILFFDLLTGTRVDIDRLYDEVKKEKKFVVSFPDVELSIEDIWPDGDAPEEPATEDVLRQMHEEGVNVLDVIAGWHLLDTLAVDGVDWHDIDA